MQLWPLVICSFFAELIELSWQFAPTLRQALERIDRLFRRSVFLLLLGHTGYLCLLWLSLRYEVHAWPVIFAIALKSLDIFTKIELLRNLRGGSADPEMEGVLDLRIPLWLWLVGPLTYPWLVWLALGSG